MPESNAESLMVSSDQNMHANMPAMKVANARQKSESVRERPLRDDTAADRAEVDAAAATSVVGEAKHEIRSGRSGGQGQSLSGKTKEPHSSHLGQ